MWDYIFFPILGFKKDPMVLPHFEHSFVLEELHDSVKPSTNIGVIHL